MPLLVSPVKKPSIRHGKMHGAEAAYDEYESTLKVHVSSSGFAMLRNRRVFEFAIISIG